jgi:hypothetical protein
MRSTHVTRALEEALHERLPQYEIEVAWSRRHGICVYLPDEITDEDTRLVDAMLRSRVADFKLLQQLPLVDGLGRKKQPEPPEPAGVQEADEPPALKLDWPLTRDLFSDEQ